VIQKLSAGQEGLDLTCIASELVDVFCNFYRFNRGGFNKFIYSDKTAQLLLFVCFNTTVTNLEDNCRKPITYFNPLKAELNPICQLLALLGAHHIIHVSGIRVKYHTLCR
jgi:hypothetical protein